MKQILLVCLACLLGMGCRLFETDPKNGDRPADSQEFAPLPAELPEHAAAPPSVTPPRPAGWAENLPSLPESGIPDVEVRPPTGTMMTTSSETGPLRELLAQGRKRRMDRREDRREERNEPAPIEPLQPATPAAPIVPVQPITPPPLPATGPTFEVPRQDSPPQPEPNPAAAIVAKSVQQYAKVSDYEARFVKREILKGKQLPEDVILYRFRKEPLSVYMKILSDEGRGREVMYVKDQFDNDMHVITGKGDTFLGTGIKTTVEPDSRQAASKSRRRIYEAGFGRALTQLQQNLSQVKSLGQVKRPESTTPMEALELAVHPGTEPDMPQGGVRRYYFESNEQSASYMLPVLIITTDANGKEIEYYSFTQLKVPSGMSNANWNPAKLGKK